MVVHGIAGIGKSTLVAHWLEQQISSTPNLSFVGILVNRGIHHLGSLRVYSQIWD